MHKLIQILICCALLSSCEKREANVPEIKDLVIADLPFEVHFVPCDNQEDPACALQPINEATIRIFKKAEDGQELQFIAEKKTNEEGFLNFVLVPLGNYKAEVSTNQYGDQEVQATSFVGRTSAVRVRF